MRVKVFRRLDTVDGHALELPQGQLLIFARRVAILAEIQVVKITVIPKVAVGALQ